SGGLCGRGRVAGAAAHRHSGVLERKENTGRGGERERVGASASRALCLVGQLDLRIVGPEQEVKKIVALPLAEYKAAGLQRFLVFSQ
nr:hypothetical protein [Tanacetum cinerariifolium]